MFSIGPVDLTQGTVTREGTVPTVTDSLLEQRRISNESIGIFYQPTTENNLANGELTFGGVDETKYVLILLWPVYFLIDDFRVSGDVTYVPLTSVSPACNYWGIDQQVQYNSQTILEGAGIVDTGTTLLLLATDSFEAYKKATSGEMDRYVPSLLF